MTLVLPSRANRIARVEELYRSSIRALLHFNGSNGSSVFTDSGPNALSITRAGGAQISTGQSKFGGASGLFDGSGDYIYNDHATAFDITGDYTIELFIRATEVGGVPACIVDLRNGGGGVVSPFCELTPGRAVQWFWNGGTRATSPAISLNTWYHLAACRASDVTRFFLDGVQFGSDYNSSAAMLATALSIATYVDRRNTDAAYKFAGYIDEFRITGAARYTANFTPPSAEFPDP